MKREHEVAMAITARMKLLNLILRLLELFVSWREMVKGSTNPYTVNGEVKKRAGR